MSLCRCQDSPNLLAPLELDLMHKAKGVTINPTDSLLIITAVYIACNYCRISPITWNTVLGMRGVELRVGSGEQGYFQVRIVAGSHTIIGLATHKVILGAVLGYGRGSLGWDQTGGITSAGIPGTESEFGGGDRRKFGTNDVVGLMVDCTELPTLRFFVNGVQVYWVVVMQKGYGQYLYPAFCLEAYRAVPNPDHCEMQIASNPDLPILYN